VINLSNDLLSNAIMIWYPYAYICTCRRKHGMPKQMRKCTYSITLMAHLVVYKSGAHGSYILQTI